MSFFYGYLPSNQILLTANTGFGQIAVQRAPVQQVFLQETVQHDVATGPVYFMNGRLVQNVKRTVILPNGTTVVTPGIKYL